MTFQLPSMSGLAPAEECRAFMTLPQDTSPAGERAQFGSDAHSEWEAYINAFLEDAELWANRPLLTEVGLARSDDPEFTSVVSIGRAWIRDNFSPTWKPEEALAWDWNDDTGRPLPAKFQRDYSAKRQNEIPGTTDILAIESDEKGEYVDLLDWKTGRSGPEHYKMQMVGLSLAASRATGIHRVRTRIVYFRAGQEPYVHERWFDSMELDDWADKIRSWVVEAIAGAEPNAGPWCTKLYCKARFSCPKTNQALQTAQPGSHVSLPVVASDITSIEAASQLYRQLKTIEESQKKASAALKEFVIQVGGDVPLGNGESLAIRQKTRNNVDGKAALAILVGMGVDAGLIGGLQSTTTYPEMYVKKGG